MSSWEMPAGDRGYSDAAGVAMDEHFHLFVADPHADRVRHFSAFGRHLGDLGASGPDTGDEGRDRPGVLDRPHAVALLGDTVVVAGGDRPRRRAVQRFARGGEALRPLSSGGVAEATFGAPRGLAVHGEELFVADTLAGRIQRFRDGVFVAHLPVRATGAARPVGVLRLEGDLLLVADRGDDAGLVAITTSGAPSSAAAGMVRHLQEPSALAADQRGRIYVLDRGGERVVRFTPDLAFDDVVVDLAEHLEDYERGT